MRFLVALLIAIAILFSGCRFCTYTLKSGACVTMYSSDFPSKEDFEARVGKLKLKIEDAFKGVDVDRTVAKAVFDFYNKDQFASEFICYVLLKNKVVKDHEECVEVLYNME